MLARSRPSAPGLLGFNKRFWPLNEERITLLTDERISHLRNCMYQYSRAIDRPFKHLIDPYVPSLERLEYRRLLLAHGEHTTVRPATDPPPFDNPDQALAVDLR